MTTSWFAGLPPHAMLHFMRLDAEVWGAWLCLTDADAHKLMMLIEVEALRQEVEVQLYATQVFVEGPGMHTPAWSVAARTTTGEWQDV